MEEIDWKARALTAEADATVLRGALERMVKAFVTETIFQNSTSDRSLARDAARVALKSAPASAAFLAEHEALKLRQIPEGCFAICEGFYKTGCADRMFTSRQDCTAKNCPIREALRSPTREVGK